MIREDDDLSLAEVEVVLEGACVLGVECACETLGDLARQLLLGVLERVPHFLAPFESSSTLIVNLPSGRVAPNLSELREPRGNLSDLCRPFRGHDLQAQTSRPNRLGSARFRCTGPAAEAEMHPQCLKRTGVPLFDELSSLRSLRARCRRIGALEASRRERVLPARESGDHRGISATSHRQEARHRVPGHRPAEFLLDEPMNLSDSESRLRSPQNPKHGGLNRALRWSHRPAASCAVIAAGRLLALSIEQLSQGDATVMVRKCPG